MGNESPGRVATSGFGQPLRRALVKFGGILDSQLFFDPGPVAVHRGGAEVQLSGNFPRIQARARRVERLRSRGLKAGPSPRVAPPGPRAQPLQDGFIDALADIDVARR